jgi:hypothetical protein
MAAFGRPPPDTALRSVDKVASVRFGKVTALSLLPVRIEKPEGKPKNTADNGAESDRASIVSPLDCGIFSNESWLRSRPWRKGYSHGIFDTRFLFAASGNGSSAAGVRREDYTE